MTQIREGSIKLYRIIIHGNNGFTSSQLLEQLNITPERCSLETGKGRFELFPFTDLNLINKYLPIQPCPEMTRLIERSQSVDVSAILVLISQTEIFSQGMYDLISKLPYKDDKFGYRFGNEKEWWSRVIVVFSFGDKEGGGAKVKESIAGNSGIRGIVAKAGNRYICVSNTTTPEEFTGNLYNILSEKLKRKLIVRIDRSPEERVEPFSIKTCLMSFIFLSIVTPILMVMFPSLICILPFMCIFIPLWYCFCRNKSAGLQIKPQL